MKKIFGLIIIVVILFGGLYVYKNDFKLPFNNDVAKVTTTTLYIPPILTDAPKETTVTTTTKKSVQTTAPKVTTTPKVTTMPKVTTTPKVTTIPNVTTAPTTTKKPTNTSRTRLEQDGNIDVPCSGDDCISDNGNGGGDLVGH